MNFSNNEMTNVYNKIKVIFIDGNISSGKSTLLRNLQNMINSANYKYKEEIMILQEPIEEWTNINTLGLKHIDNNNLNLLQAFYDDPKKHGLTFQTYTILTRIDLLINTINKLVKDPLNKVKIIIAERSIIGDYVFAENSRVLGYFDDYYWAIYNKYFDFYFNNFMKCLDYKIVYLQTYPEVCYNRMKIRHRNEEDKVSIDYLKSLSEISNDVIVNNENTIIIDSNLDEETVFKNFTEKLEMLIAEDACAL